MNYFLQLKIIQNNCSNCSVDASDVTFDGKKQRGKEDAITEEVMADGAVGDNEEVRTNAEELIEANKINTENDGTSSHSQEDVDDLRSLLTDMSQSASTTE